MRFYLLCSYGLEGARASVKCDISDFCARGLNFLQETVGEMKPGGGGSDSAGCSGEDGLIAAAVQPLQISVWSFAFDVRG